MKHHPRRRYQTTAEPSCVSDADWVLGRFANPLVHASLAHPWGKRYEALMIGSDQPNVASSLSSPTSQLCQKSRFVDPQRVQQILSGSAYPWCRYGASLCCRITISRGFQGLQLTLSWSFVTRVGVYQIPQYRFPGSDSTAVASSLGLSSCSAAGHMIRAPPEQQSLGAPRRQREFHVGLDDERGRPERLSPMPSSFSASQSQSFEAERARIQDVKHAGQL